MRWVSVPRAYMETSQVGGAPWRVRNHCCHEAFRVEPWDRVTNRESAGGPDQNGSVFSPGVFVLAYARDDGCLGARAVGVHVGEDRCVVDFLGEENVNVVPGVLQNTAADDRLFLQVV